MEGWEKSNWWGYMDEKMRELMKQSYALIEQESGKAGESKFYDYSFVVFPAAKAYEGFLKKAFLDMGLISKQQYFSDHFRIGRALSPTLPKRYRAGWVYGKLLNYCGGEELPMAMWEVWKKARNRTFHFFPQYQERVSLEEARELVEEIADIMSRVLMGCKLG